MALRLQGVTAGYGDTEVLRDIDLVVPTGCVVALLGPNGAGKTTLLRATAGLIPVRGGRIYLDELDVTEESADRRSRSGLCLIPEGRGIFPTLTVVEHLRMFGARGSEDVSRVFDAFPKLGTRRSQPVGTMSGGEQQMVALSRALLAGAGVVLLDEVSMGLAPQIVAEVFDFIDSLRESGCSLLLVEQYVTKALEIADYVYLLQRGQFRFAGEPGEVDSDSLFADYIGGAA